MTYVPLHQLNPFPGPVPPWNDMSDPNIVRGNDNQIQITFNAHDADSTIHLTGGATGGTLTFGTHLTSGGASFNGSANVTITSDATSANTVSTIVARDGSGNFSAGAISAALTGNVTGNLTGTVLTATQASITTMANLTTIGTLVAGAVPASLVTAGTFGSGAYTFPSTLNVVSTANIGDQGIQPNAFFNVQNSTALNASSGAAYMFDLLGNLKAAANNDVLFTLRIVSTNNANGKTGTAAAGIYVENVSGAATNYAIFTNTGLLRFGDAATFTSTITSGLINGQTISATANFTGSLAAVGPLTLTNTAVSLSLVGTGVTSALISYTTNGTARWTMGTPSGSSAWTLTNGSSVDQLTITQASGATFAGAVAVGALTATTGHVTGAGTFDTTLNVTGIQTNATTMFVNPAGAGIFGHWGVQRAGTTYGYLGLDAANKFAILNANATVAVTVDTVGNTSNAVFNGTLGVTGATAFSKEARLQNTTVGGLTAAATAGAGALSFVTDAVATAITGLGLAVVGGGGNKVVVYSDGANWIII